MNLYELRASIAEARKKITGRKLEQHDIFEAHERLHSYVAQAKEEKKSIRRKDSSKKHQEKTLKNDQDRIDYKENQPSSKTYNKTDDEDDSDFEIYPIG